VVVLLEESLLSSFSLIHSSGNQKDKLKDMNLRVISRPSQLQQEVPYINVSPSLKKSFRWI